MIVALLLIIINVFLLLNTKEPQEITEVREKYRILREHLIETDNKKFEMLQKEVPITVHHRINRGDYLSGISMFYLNDLCLEFVVARHRLFELVD